jgi:Ni/Co efflux regulator RcnB
MLVIPKLFSGKIEMRKLLISAALTSALALLTMPASAQPDNPHRIGKASMGPQVQDQAQAQAGVPPQVQGGPQVTGQQPQQAQQQQGGRGDRGGNRGAAQPTAQPQGGPQLTGQPPQQGQNDRGGARGNDNRGNNDNHGDWRGNRGNDQRDYRGDGRDDRRDNWQGGQRGDWRGNDQRDYRGDGRDDRRGNWQGGQRGDDYNFNNRGYGNRGAYDGQRHDFRGYRDFHRSFRAERRFRGPIYRRPAGWYDHRWSFGEFLPSAFWARDYWLSDYRAYDLQPPPYGAIWVRVGDDALLVDQDSGEVITVEYGVFY